MVLVWRLEGEKEEERAGADANEGMGEGRRRREWKGEGKSGEGLRLAQTGLAAQPPTGEKDRFRFFFFRVFFLNGCIFFGSFSC